MTNPVTAPEYQAEDGWRANSPFLQLTRTLVGFIQGLFAQCPPGSYHWAPDSEEGGSEIFIGSDTPIDPEVIGARPAITVTRGPGAFQGVGIGDIAYSDIRTGAQVRMDILPVTASINVLSRIPIEADELAWFVTRHIWSLRDKIVRENSGIMYLGNRPSVSAVSPAGSLVGPDTEHNWVVVGVSLPAYLQYSATTMPLNTGTLAGISVVGKIGRAHV